MKRGMMFAVFLAFASAGCTAPPSVSLSLVRDEGVEAARDKMFSLYAGKTRLASVSMIDEATDNPTAPQVPEPVPAPLAGAAPVFDDSCEQLEKKVAADVEKLWDGMDRSTVVLDLLEKRVKALEEKCALCPCGVKKVSAVSSSEPTLVDWPDGCTVEAWVAASCEPCLRFEKNEFAKLPNGVCTIRSKTEEPDAAAAAGVGAAPFFILKDPNGVELVRIIGFVTADRLASRAKELLANPIPPARSQTLKAVYDGYTASENPYLQNLKQHLAATHGIDCSGLTQEQCEDLHNQAHGMPTVAAQMARATSPQYRTGGGQTRYTSRNGVTTYRVNTKYRN